VTAGPDADRYGTRRPRRTDRRLLAGGAAVAVTAGVAFLGWVAWHQGRQVSWQEVAFDPADQSRPGLTFQVTRPSGATVTCTVTALNGRHAVVGRRDVVVPAGPDRTVQLVTTVRTAEPAVAVAVDRCAVTG
jgi:hypothetical protein